MPRFFSVVICTFNRARLLPRALDSVLAQSEGDWEVVIVDDGSTDDTKEIIQRYTSISPNIHYFLRSCNRGIGAARNIGVTISKDRYVTFLDSDDEYAVDHLASRKEILVSDPAIRFLHGGIKILGDPFVVDKDDVSKRIHLDNCAVGGTFFIRRDVFTEIGGFDDLGYAEDARFLEKAAAMTIEPRKTEHRSYLYYRNVNGQLTSQIASGSQTANKKI